MKLQVLLLVALAAGVAGCTSKEESAPAAATEPAAADKPAWRTEAFISHMHDHAEMLDRLNFALADEDLHGALTPAYWLSTHETVNGLPDELQAFVRGMRTAAQAVEEAPDLETARAAAEQITVQCQGCHEAAGVN